MNERVPALAPTTPVDARKKRDSDPNEQQKESEQNVKDKVEGTKLDVELELLTSRDWSIDHVVLSAIPSFFDHGCCIGGNFWIESGTVHTESTYRIRILTS